MIKRGRGFLALGIFLLLACLTTCSDLIVEASVSPEYERFVHTFSDSFSGNWTYMEKCVFPIFWNRSEIQIGMNWSVVCPLSVNHSYHAYCYGDWIDWEEKPETDYDIYVYDPFGSLVGYHTESAGLPEHLGSTVDDPFFVPENSGNYTFVVRNDPRESNASEPASFMIIENVECNVWHEHYVRGKYDMSSVLETGWSYEFATGSEQIEVVVKVPETLDMYEVRLYLMANPDSGMGSFLNNVPLAWEAGLYGERDELFGGYNLESQEDRGVAYASCEFYGEDMFLNFTSPYPGECLYHLVFIGEEGSGTVRFAVKTELEQVGLKPIVTPFKEYAYEDVMVAYRSNLTDLMNATLYYSTDSWKNLSALDMEINDEMNCSVVIPGQVPGTSVSYRIEAFDVLENALAANGSYCVKSASALNLSSVRDTVFLGENVTVKGILTPAAGDVPVSVHFISVNASKEIVCYTMENGTFLASLKPKSISTWKIRAEFVEDKFRYSSTSSEVLVKVEERPFLMKYGYYIGGGVGAIALIGIIVYVKRSRE